MTGSETAAYHVDGNRVHPTDRARGPWFAEQQHGAAVLALLARFLERVPSARPMRFTRITADLSRAVPMTEVSVVERVHRDGSRVQSLEASILAGDEVVARAMATRIRVEPGLIEPECLLVPPKSDSPPPFDGTPTNFGLSYTNFHNSIEVVKRDVTEDPFTDSPYEQTWYRLADPLVAGEQPSPTVRLAAAADMIGSAAYHLPEGWMSINPEVMVQIEREPVGEWVCTSSTVRFGDDGVGMTSCVLFDRAGRVGASAKSLLNTPR